MTVKLTTAKGRPGRNFSSTTAGILIDNLVDSRRESCEDASLSDHEKVSLLARASEGGYFEEAFDRWLNSENFSRVEAEAYRDLYDLARRLLGGATLPSVSVFGECGGNVGCRIGEVEWRDHRKHGSYSEVRSEFDQEGK